MKKMLSLLVVALLVGQTIKADMQLKNETPYWVQYEGTIKDNYFAPPTSLLSGATGRIAVISHQGRIPFPLVQINAPEGSHTITFVGAPKAGTIVLSGDEESGYTATLNGQPLDVRKAAWLEVMKNF